MSNILHSNWCVGMALAMVLSSCGAAPDQESAGAVEQDITGGSLVTNTGAPWNGTLALPSLGCTGAKIAQNRILTAAHCIPPGTLTQVSATNSLDGSGATSFSVRRAYVHPSYLLYAHVGASYDIALIETSGNLPDSWATIPIDTQYFADGASGYAIGYGCDDTNPANGGKKQFARFTALSLSALYPLTSNSNAVDQNDHTHLVMHNSPFTQLCPGDSGGPLMRQNSSGTWVISGVNSFRAGTTNGTRISGLPRTGNVSSWLRSPGYNILSNASVGTFINAQSHLCASVEPFAPNNNVFQHYCDGRGQSVDPQYWTLIARNQSDFNIKNTRTGACLGLSTDGSIRMWNCTNSDQRQLWYFTGFSGAPQTFQIRSPSNTGKCIRPTGSSSEHGATLTYGACGDSSAQWLFSR